jgi:hypothetical protein
MSTVGQRWPRPYPLGQVPAGGSADQILTKVTGTDYDYAWEDPVSSGGVPESPISGAALLYEADSITGLSDGDPISQWDDESGNAKHLTASGSARPTYRAEDGGDGLPYLEFDGTDDALSVTGLTSYTGTVISIYLVMRYITTSGNPGVLSLSRSGSSDWNETQSLCITTYSSNRISMERNSVVGPQATKTQQTLWVPVCLRIRTVHGTQIASIYVAGEQCVATHTNSAFAYTLLVLASRWTTAISNPMKGGIRAVAVYHDDHTDAQMLYMLRYLSRHGTQVP